MATISNTPRPGYVFDVTDNVWYPIGVGGHSHGEIPATIADAKGDLIVGTAADTVARLAVGTNGQVLTADSSEATGLKYATPASGGKVLQVVHATYGTSQTSTSTTYADTNLTATITPTLNTSKVLVIVSQCGVTKHGDAGAGVALKLRRGSTDILQMDYRAAWNNVASQFNFIGSVSGNYLDSPATTSATTYKTMFANYSAVSSVFVQQDGAVSSITLMEIGA